MVSEQTCTIDHKMDQGLWQTSESIDFLHSSYMCIQSILSCGKTLPHNADWGLFQDSDFAGDFKDSKSTSGGHYAFLEVIRLFQAVGCVRNKLQFRTVQQNQKSFPWTQDWSWTVYPRLIHVICSSQFFTETRIRVIKNGETRTRTKFVSTSTNFQRERNFIVLIIVPDNVDFISSNVNSSHQEALFVCV